jgi:hypothetical protein
MAEEPLDLPLQMDEGVEADHPLPRLRAPDSQEAAGLAEWPQAGPTHWPDEADLA